MKKLLLLLVLASFNVCLSAAPKALVVTFDNGLTATYALADEPTVTVADNQLTVTLASGAVTTHPLATVLTFTFAETTSIDTPTTSTPSLTRSGETIIISAPVAVTATTVAGAAVPVTVTRTATSTTIDLSSLPHGLTIVTAAGQTFKYLRK